MVAKRSIALAALAAGGVAALRRARGRAALRPGPAEWFAVTVACDPAELTGVNRPDALAELAEHHEVRISPAPGGRGTELAVHSADGTVREQVRALKQLLETGEVLRMEGQPEGHRTVLGRATLPVARQLMRRGVR
ncbi:hypothetical protein HS041_23290 [Planomonospora sp. ID67723]|uniref:hypothetical protein n=1 Tax=Planomonospora sp. ID67723 TaxID=2738134 RepID=UPI0018C3A695|nr:hypothetical protein [Planomonospora sp. ID67723]MBG0830689.1 hypothetical protein [Planomonospora sp. ID67723]